ncbi:hypothetical protein BGZ67_005565 [Mortierella alpina]|nr:hypothetical protein BGZ67_005565 [Mortierella alpina]
MLRGPNMADKDLDRHAADQSPKAKAAQWQPEISRSFSPRVDAQSMRQGSMQINNNGESSGPGDEQSQESSFGQTLFTPDRIERKLMRNTTVMTLHSDSESGYEDDFDLELLSRYDHDDGDAMVRESAVPSISIHGQEQNFINFSRSSVTGETSSEAKSSQYIRFSLHGSGALSGVHDPSDDDSLMDAGDQELDEGSDLVKEDSDDDDDDDEDEDEEEEGDSEDSRLGMKNVLGSYLLAPMGFDDDDNLATSPGMEGYVEAAERFQIFAGVNEFDESDQIGLSDHPYQVVPKSKRKDQERLLENKRRQGKLLLVSLLDNFCLLYDQSPERNRKLFYVICKTLSNMGIIDEEYLEEMSAVRSSYQRAFRSLVVSALTSIKQEQMIMESRRIMAPPSTPTESRERRGRGADMTSRDSSQSISDSLSLKGLVPSAYLHTPQVTTSAFPSATNMMRTLSFGDMFDNDPTRYKHDFVELSKLGKGGFASVFKARNKLDGIEYAIKKIRLRGGAKVRYEKIFREIKFLARLDHTNVIRYYSSWLEHADYPVSRREMFSDGGVGGMDSNGELDDEYDDEYGDEDDYTNTNTRSMGDQVVIPERQRRRSIDYFGPHAEQHPADPEDLSMGIVFGEYDDGDDSSPEIDFEDVSQGQGDAQTTAGRCGLDHHGVIIERFENLMEGEDMERTHSASSTLTSRIIPGATKTEPPRRKHKQPTVSLEMQGRPLAWEETEEESARRKSSISTSYSALSSSIEEIQRSLPSSYSNSNSNSNSNSGLGSRYGHSHPDDRTLATLETNNAIRPFSFPDQKESNRRDFIGGGIGGLHGAGSACGGRGHRDRGGRLITRDLTLFIQMQLCQTTLQDYLVYRNERPVAVPKRLHNELSKRLRDRNGISSASSPTERTHSTPGSPLQQTCHKDLVDPAANQHIFRAIVEGVAYIHDQDMIHRDLKPSNIFLGMPGGTEYQRTQQQQQSDHTSRLVSSAVPGAMTTMSSASSRQELSLQQSFASQYPDYDQCSHTREQIQEELFTNIEAMVPKIGDFGLVTDMEGGATMDAESGTPTPTTTAPGPSPPNSNEPLLRRHSSAVTTGSRSSRTRTTAVGTVTYASPEQLARPNLGYDQKADIYSLGIIFFELYHPFSTLMERHAVLRTLRNGELPPDFVSRWPKEAAFVLWLMAEDPQMRPTAREILDFDLIRKSKEDPATFSSTTTPMFTTTTEIVGETGKDHQGRTIAAAAATLSHGGHPKLDVVGGAVAEIEGLGLLASNAATASSLTSVVIKSAARVICEGCQSRCRCFEPLRHQDAKPETAAGLVKDEDDGENGGQRVGIDSLKGHNNSSNNNISSSSSTSKGEKSKRQNHRGHRSTKSTTSSTLLTSKLPRTELEQKLSEESEKVQRLEMSMAAIRAENRALLDRIQQLEYEKETSWRRTDETGYVDEDDDNLF